MSSQRSVTQRAELRAYGPTEGDDLDPDEMTRLLGMTPSKLSRRGDVLKFSGRIQPCTVWWWETDERVETDCERVVTEVLDTFEPVATQLIEMQQRWSLDLVLGVVINMSGTLAEADDGTTWADIPTPALSFSRETMARIAALNLHLDIDQYISAPDDEDDDRESSAPT